jgi:hypothetical protein
MTSAWSDDAAAEDGLWAARWGSVPVAARGQQNLPRGVHHTVARARVERREVRARIADDQRRAALEDLERLERRRAGGGIPGRERVQQREEPIARAGHTVGHGVPGGLRRRGFGSPRGLGRLRLGRQRGLGLRLGRRRLRPVGHASGERDRLREEHAQ